MGRPSARVLPEGVRLVSMTTGMLRPMELMYPRLTDRSFESARSIWMFESRAHWVLKSASTAAMACFGAEAVEMPAGKAGAPAVVGVTVVLKDFGSPFRRIASSYMFNCGGSYMIPVDARRTVLFSLSSA